MYVRIQPTERHIIVRKFIISLTAGMFCLVWMTDPANAEDVQPAELTEQEQPTPVVECHVRNITPRELLSSSGEYFVGLPITLEVVLTDPSNAVANIVFAAVKDQKGGILQDGGTNQRIEFVPVAPGIWQVGAQLFDEIGNEIIASGDCYVELNVVEGQTVPNPPSEERPPEPIPTTAVPTTTPPPPAAPVPVETAAATLPHTGYEAVIALFGASMVLMGSSFIYMKNRMMAQGR